MMCVVKQGKLCSASQVSRELTFCELDIADTHCQNSNSLPIHRVIHPECQALGYLSICMCLYMYLYVVCKQLYWRQIIRQGPMDKEKNLFMNGAFCFLKSCPHIFGKVGESDRNMVSVIFVSATLRNRRWKLACKTSISSIMTQHICVERLGSSDARGVV